MKLNNEQLAAVRHISGPLLVLAGAGSGKTRVITEKIKYLIRECHYAPATIFAVTFTNKAAKEMAERVKKALKQGEGKGLKVATFHTLGLLILKKHGHLCGLKPGFSIYDQKDSLNLLTDLLGGDLDEAKLAAQQISSWKNDRLSPAEALALADNDFLTHSATLYGYYFDQLSAYNAVDFDDLILKPLLLLRGVDAVRHYWQTRMHYLLVDEYQDTNMCQYELVKLLTGVRQALTVVGDDDQSIYAWRGARPENLHRLHEDFPTLKLIKLEQNYRSTGHILSAANHVIRVNPHLYEKALWSNLGMGEQITIDEFKSAQEEIDFVALSIMHEAPRKGNEYHQFAVLYRGNHQAKAFEMALRMRNIPVQVVGGTSFFQQPEIKELLAYLKLITNTDDSASLLRIINIPRREIGAVSLKKLVEFAQVHCLTLFDALAHGGLTTYLGKALAFKCQTFHGLITACQQKMHTHNARVVLDHLLLLINYEDYLRESSTSPKAFERKLANVNYLGEWFNNYDESLTELLAHLTLVSILENERDVNAQNAVTLMTLHSAKGLEFPFVYMVGLEEDILPHKNSIDNDTVEEERRLFYVGVTRAQRNLAITYCRQRRRYGEWEMCTPSRFLAELPKEHVQWRAENTQTAEEQQQGTLAAIQDLKAMLRDI